MKNLKDHLLNEVTLYFNIPQLTRVSFLNKEKIVLLFSISSINEYHNIMEQYFSRSSKLLGALSKHYNSKIYITAGKLTDSIYSIHESYDEAEHLLHQFEQLNSSRQILSYYDWDVLVELLPYKLHESLKSYVLFRLKRIESDKLYEDIKKTFTAYCENGMNITATANHLYVHRNTVIYRLNKLEEIASIDVKNFQHCSLLYLVFKN